MTRNYKLLSIAKWNEKEPLECWGFSQTKSPYEIWTILIHLN